MAAKTAKTDQMAKLKKDNATLKAKNKALEDKVASLKVAKDSKSKQRNNLLRTIGTFLFVTLAVLILALGNLVFWTGNTAINQQRFVAATTPIIKNSDVQHAMALYTTNNLYHYVNVQKITEQVLPPRAYFLAQPLASQLQSLTQSTLQKALQNPKLQNFWNTTLTNQHKNIISFIASYKGNGAISINNIYNQLSLTLNNTPLKFLANKTLPSKIGSITIVNATYLPTAHDVVTNIALWRILAIILTLACLSIAIILSRNRRKTVEAIGLSILFAMFVTLVLLRIATHIIIAKAAPEYQAGVGAAIHIFSASLKDQTILIGLIGLVITLIAWLTGSSKPAQSIKKASVNLSGKTLQTKLASSKFKNVPIWANKNIKYLQWGALILIAIIMLLVQLTTKTFLILLILLVLLELIIIVIGGKPVTSTKKITKK